MNITEKKKLSLLRIEKARVILDRELSNGVITEQDLLSLLHARQFYGLKTKNRIYNYKQSILIDIFNSPFILCDQDNLSIEIKKILPLFLSTRYIMELEQLNLYYKENYISEKEYIEEKQLLKYCFYESSIDGKSILKKGHVDNVIDNISRVR